MMDFIGTAAPLLPGDLDDVEQRFGFRFPQAFRLHYLRHNGGHPDRNQFVDANGALTVHDFLPIKASTTPTVTTLETALKWLKVDQHILPDRLIPFANDPLGNLFCFSAGEKDFGAVYWWRAEGREEIREEFLAHSLDEFLGKLRRKGEP